MANLNLTEAATLIKASIDADQPIHLIGPPGVGKTEMVNALGRELGMEVVPCILSQMDLADVGGIPVPDPKTGAVLRLPMGPIRRASEKGVVLFMDEYLNAHPALQGASLTLILERWAGDFKLHSDTRIVLASNPVHQSAGGHEQTLPSLGRMTTIHIVPTLEEFRAFCQTIGADANPIENDPKADLKVRAQAARARILRDLGFDLSGILGAEPGLWQCEPPANAQASGEPYGAPRNWIRALKLLSQLYATGHAEPSKGELTNVVMGALAGNVGESTAHAYVAIMRTRHKLPSIDEIIADPKGAKLPTDQASGVAAIGLLANVGRKDACAGWLYTNRLQDEIKVASARTLFKFGMDSKHPMYTEANKVKIGILAKVSTAIAG